MLCTAPGAGGPSPSHGLLCVVSELERRALALNILSFYMQVVLTHHSHSGPCTHLFNLDILETPVGWREGFRVTSLVCRVSFPSGPVNGCGEELG